MLDWVHSVTDLCLLGLLPSPHQGVGLGGNCCCGSQFLTSTQGIKVSFLFLFFSPAINRNLCSLGRSLIKKQTQDYHWWATADSLLHLGDTSKWQFAENLKIGECAGKLIPLWETKERSRFNLAAPPGRQPHESGRLSQSVAGKRNSNLQRFIIIDGIGKLWQQPYLLLTLSECLMSW